jgi:D-alanyl-D-alanine carboxypeptidase/D-alanyl-D-alanine-endopeptidase (penicillin-binding protein 4)
VATRRQAAGVLLVAALIGTLLGEPANADTGPPRPPLDSALDRHDRDPRLGRNVAYIVIDPATGAVLGAQSPDRPMQAASNMKLVTAATALATMGPDRRFATRVLVGSSPSRIVLQGAGDPLLTRANLRTLADRTAARLKRGAHVRVHVDGDLFPRPTRAPGWVDAYLGNSVGLTQALALHGDHSRRPSRNAAEAFTARLRELGLRASLSGNEDAAADAAVIASYRGHSVSKAIATMLRESDSGIAEVLFRQVAVAVGRPPTWRGSTRAAMETLRAMGLDTRGLVLADGSGLSRKDRLTPRFLASLLTLARVTDRGRYNAIFQPSALPTAGRSGTLTQAYGRYSTYPSRCAAGRVRAKTGTIRGTIALSGVSNSVNGKLRIFSIIVNDRPQRYSALSTRRAVDGLAAIITGCWS